MRVATCSETEEGTEFQGLTEAEEGDSERVPEVETLPPQGAQVQSLVEKIPWRRKWQPTPVPGESHGQKSLVGYSPCGCKELDICSAGHN